MISDSLGTLVVARDERNGLLIASDVITQYLLRADAPRTAR